MVSFNIQREDRAIVNIGGDVNDYTEGSVLPC